MFPIAFGDVSLDNSYTKISEEDTDFQKVMLNFLIHFDTEYLVFCFMQIFFIIFLLPK